MTPKQKAEQLVADFGALALYDAKVDLSAVDIRYAKKCALISVEEIIKSNPTTSIFEDDYNEIEMIDTQYWEQVKTEIESL